MILFSILMFLVVILAGWFLFLAYGYRISPWR